MHSASRTDLDSNFQHTASSSDPNRPPQINRSQSYPGFDAAHKAHNVHYFDPTADTNVINDAEDFEYKPTDLSGPLHLSFCGCGFVGMYHLGVVSCLLAHGDSFLERVEKVAGSSAGALMAAVMLCAPDRIEEVAEQLQSLARELRSRPLGALTPGYSFARALRLLLDDVLPEDAHVQVSGKLHVSLTAAGGQGSDKAKKKTNNNSNNNSNNSNSSSSNNELMTDFETREELVEALVASSYIPLYAGLKMPVIRGKYNNCMITHLPVSLFCLYIDHIITVTHFASSQVSVRNVKKGAHVFFPPKRHVLQEYFNLGRFDASRFLIREGLYSIKLIHCAEKAVYVSSV
ncbi:hypothetical protein EGW08_021005 [Elysia chlorotica]|uniref:PNPLA domain-containing protein n=1 Tax=Elysia chlorotica TaxID=188477 RepID=A0A3S0Z5N9_ELYCH|nr:hypothetical protein EGW08_021005 [Elysia chlorotica]